jgi:hypothetical protein
MKNCFLKTGTIIIFLISYNNFPGFGQDQLLLNPVRKLKQRSFPGKAKASVIIIGMTRKEKFMK